MSVKSTSDTVANRRETYEDTPRQTEWNKETVTMTWSPAFRDSSSKLRAVKSYIATYFWYSLESSANDSACFTSAATIKE